MTTKSKRDTERTSLTLMFILEKTVNNCQVTHYIQKMAFVAEQHEMERSAPDSCKEYSSSFT